MENRTDNTVVYGLYETREKVEAAVDRLRSAGFRASDVSVLLPTPDGMRQFAHTKETKAPEGAAAGGASGAILGGALGWLAGIGAIAIPGVGPFIAAGPIVGLLAGAGAGGMLGGIGGALVGMGIPEYEAQRFEGRIREGGILLSVHVDDDEWEEKALDLLKRTGGDEISVASEASADYKAPDPRSLQERRTHSQR